MATFAAQTSKFCNMLVCNLLSARDFVSSAAFLQRFLLKEIPKKLPKGFSLFLIQGKRYLKRPGSPYFL